MTSQFKKFKALSYKNWILFKRSPCISCCEVCFPTVFIAALLMFYHLVNSSNDGADSPLFHKDSLTQKENPVDPGFYTSFNGVQSLTPGPEYIYQVDGWNFKYATDTSDFEESEFFGRKDPGVAGYCQFAYGPTGKSAFIDTALQSAVLDLAEVTMKLNPPTGVSEATQLIHGFESIEDMEAYVKGDNYGKKSNPELCWAVFFNSFLNDQYDYNIYYNLTVFGGQNQQQLPIPSPLFDAWNKFVRGIQDYNVTSYRKSGFSLVQNMVHNVILRQQVTDGSISNAVAPFKAAPHINSGFFAALQGTFPFFWLLVYFVPIYRLVTTIVKDKETKIREGMKMMGLTDTVYWVSVYSYYGIIFLFLSLIYTFALWTNVFKYSDKFYVFLYFFLFAMSINSYGVFISSFFSNARAGSLSAIFIYLILYIVGSIRLDQFASGGLKSAASLFPVLAMMLGAQNISILEAAQFGVTSDTLYTKIHNYTFGECLYFMAIDAVLYLLLGLYLDQVWPTRYGLKRHPLFFLQKSFWVSQKPNYNEMDESMLDNSEEDDPDFEKVDQNLREQESRGECLVVNNLRKQFDDFTAVDGLNIKMYEGQIFALLGHNGAGKTTTISCLSGLLTATSGSARVFNRDMFKESDEVRKTLGLCPQHDVLFDNLNVEEHLRMYAVFKGVPSNKIKEAVAETIKKVDLLEKAKTLSKHLSGGQKRKLSVGIALLGGSKLVFLDEPTSGMDVTARRKLWDMLKNNKQGRIIILTTHFMDEADILGDRIGIMSTGKLKCCGSSLFLKKRFGTGYNLTMVKTSSANSQEINRFVSSQIPSAVLASDVSGEISYQFPTETVSQFSTFFRELDKHMKSLGVLSYGISITTLEEVFLNLGLRVEERKAEAEAKSHQTDQEISEEKEKGSGDPDAADFNPKKFTIVGSRPESYKMRQLIALVKKRTIYSIRDYKTLFVEMLLPFIFAALMVATIKTLTAKDIPSLELKHDLFPSPQNLYMDVSDTTEKAIAENIINNSRGRFTATYETFPNIGDLSEKIYDMRDEDHVRFGSYAILSTANNNYEYVSMTNSTNSFSLPAFNLFMDEAIISHAAKKQVSVDSAIHPLPYTQKQKDNLNLASNISVGFFLGMAITFFPAGIIAYIVKEREINAKHQQIVSGCDIVIYWVSNYIVDFVKYIVSALLILILLYASNLTAFTNSNVAATTWIAFMLYGPAMISFTYLFSFVFSTSNGAQNGVIILGFFGGFAMALIVWILSLISVTSIRIGQVLLWIFRVYPNFNLSLDVLFIVLYEPWSSFNSYRPAKDPDSLAVGGPDFIYLALEAVFYFAAVIFIEMMYAQENVKGLLDRKARAYEIPPEQLDDDVVKEKERVQASTPNDMVVYCNNLKKVYTKGTGGPPTAAVKNVTFGVSKGEVFGLLGVNGAGKTSTFKMLAGQYTPTSGDVHVQGYDLKTELQYAQNYIGYCPQFDAILDVITVEEHLQLYADLKGIPRSIRDQLVEDKIKEMDLARYRKKKAGNLSGGNKRKLSVAIAMIGNPPIVFLDEPSTGMDPEARRFMWMVISSITSDRKQSAVILTTHSMEEAEALSTKMAIMVAGKYACFGTTQHLKSKFGKGYELDIKVQMPDETEIASLLQQLNLEPGSMLNMTDLSNLFNALGSGAMMQEVTEEGVGMSLFEEIKVHGSVKVEIALEWWYTETRGSSIANFLIQNFQHFELIEHYLTFFKFRVIDDTKSVGEIFASVEEASHELFISEYALTQTSLEQIFHGLVNADLAKRGARRQSSVRPADEEVNSSRAFSRPIARMATGGNDSSGSQGALIRRVTTRKSLDNSKNQNSELEKSVNRTLEEVELEEKKD